MFSALHGLIAKKFRHDDPSVSCGVFGGKGMLALLMEVRDWFLIWSCSSRLYLSGLMLWVFLLLFLWLICLIVVTCFMIWLFVGPSARCLWVSGLGDSKLHAFCVHISYKIPRGGWGGDDTMVGQLNRSGVFDVCSFYKSLLKALSFFFSLGNAFEVLRFLEGCLFSYGQLLGVGFSQ